MISLKKWDLKPGMAAVLPTRQKWRDHFYYLFGVLCLLVATLEFFQDYIDALLNNNPFQVVESLSFKFFWVLFILMVPAFRFGIKKLSNLDKLSRILTMVGLIVILSILHLVIFSLLLSGISNIIHTNAWNLTWLITEKFTTRLYIALSMYSVLTLVYMWIDAESDYRQSTETTYDQKIKVRNGSRSVFVDVDTVTWIEADGQYLNLYTHNRKHVILDTLKNIITRLPDHFKRIHRSTIVNITEIRELKSRLNGDYDVILNDGSKLRLSRNYTKPLKGILL